MHIAIGLRVGADSPGPQALRRRDARDAETARDRAGALRRVTVREAIACSHN